MSYTFSFSEDCFYFSGIGLIKEGLNFLHEFGWWADEFAGFVEEGVLGVAGAKKGFAAEDFVVHLHGDEGFFADLCDDFQDVVKVGGFFIFAVDFDDWGCEAHFFNFFVGKADMIQEGDSSGFEPDNVV